MASSTFRLVVLALPSCSQNIREYIGVIYRDGEKENGNYYSILGLYIYICIGIMEKKRETTIMGYIG